MSWVVDTCVIIDIARGDHDFAAASASAIDLKRDEGLLISPLTYVELAPSFNGDVSVQDAFLLELGVFCEFAGGREAVLKAHHAWYEHILRKRAGDVVKRPIAAPVRQTLPWKSGLARSPGSSTASARPRGRRMSSC